MSIRTEVVFSSLYPIVRLLNNVSYNAAAAIKVLSGILFLLDSKTFCSPVSRRNWKRAKVDVNSNWVCWMSTVGMLNLPDLLKRLPRSVKESIGETAGETPPSLSLSARFMHILSS